jgi:transcriptional regulator with XRE-family HTH domain
VVIHILTCYIRSNSKETMAKASRSTKALPAAAAKAIAVLAQDIATARKRRRIPQRLLAQRMMVSLDTLQRLERGDPGVGLGVIATALWALGLIDRLAALASPDQDTVGKSEELRRLPKRARVPRASKSDFDF